MTKTKKSPEYQATEAQRDELLAVVKSALPRLAEGITLTNRGHHLTIRYSLDVRSELVDQFTSQRGRVDSPALGVAIRQREIEISRPVKAALRGLTKNRWKSIMVLNDHNLSAQQVAQMVYDAKTIWLKVRIKPELRAAVDDICAKKGWTLQNFIKASVASLSREEARNSNQWT